MDATKQLDSTQFDMSRLDITKQNVKLDPGDVLTAEQAGKLLDPFIKPLPRFDDSLLPA